MYVHRLANSPQHGERQPTAEVLTKFLQAGEQLRQIAKLRMVQNQSQLGETIHHAIVLLGSRPRAREA